MKVTITVDDHDVEEWADRNSGIYVDAENDIVDGSLDTIVQAVIEVMKVEIDRSDVELGSVTHLSEFR